MSRVTKDYAADLLMQKRLRVVELWQAVRNSLPPKARAGLQAQFDTLQAQPLPDRGTLSAVEMALGNVLPEAILHSEFLYHFEKLKEQDNKRLAYFTTLRDDLFTAPARRATDSLQLVAKRAAYLSLLSELHSSATAQRIELQRFARIAQGLARVGLLCLMTAIVLILLTYKSLALTPAGCFLAWPVVQALLLLLAAVSAGGLGAFFSRMLNFQLRDKALPIAVIFQTFHQNVMFMRMVVGGMGGLVFLGLLASHLLSGDGLPDFDKLGLAASTHEFSGREFAKLLCWLLAAGFSERLVPGSLDRAIGKSES